MANFEGGGGTPERIIHDREIVYTSRSKYDAKMWICGCGCENEPVRFFLFDLPAWRCRNCRAPFPGNVDFSMADIKVNEIPLIWNIKDQKNEPECIAFAISLLMEIVHCLECILKREYLGIFNNTINPMSLATVYKSECPEMCGATPPYHDVGLHKFLCLAQHIRNKGIKLMTGKQYRIDTMSTISIKDYEWMCEELADGNPLLVNFIPGQRFAGLEYCRMYKSIGPAKIASDPDRPYTGHMAVLVGAKSNGIEKGFWVVNSHSELWCPRFNVPSIPKSLMWNLSGYFKQEGPCRGGIFKLNSDNIVWNAIKFSRSEDGPAPFGSMIRDENLYTKAARGSGEGDKANVSDFLYDMVVGSHFDKRFSADQKEEKTLSLFNHLPFSAIPSMDPSLRFSHRVEGKKILEA